MGTKCRLCDGQTAAKFEHLILGKYSSQYFECQECGSLQTIFPFWLEEAYAIKGSHIDVGQVSRILDCWINLSNLFNFLQISSTKKILDYGGATGLLTRLMRNSSYKMLCYDEYSLAHFANYFQIPKIQDEHFDIITSFEVFEHFSNPKASLGEILNVGADLIIFTTDFYECQGMEWPYLVPHCGQHVFFYSQKGLADFGTKYNYELIIGQNFKYFVKCDGEFFTAKDEMSKIVATEEFAAGHFLSTYRGTQSTADDAQLANEIFVRSLLANN